MNLDVLEERNKKSESKLRVRFDRKEIEDYARRHWKARGEGTRWNGRQIKNAFQTAVALADWDNLKYSGDDGHPDGPFLERRHFEIVARASDHFDTYLEKVRRKDTARAKELEIRRDDLGNDLDDEPISTRKKPKKNKSTKDKTKNRTKPKSTELSNDSSSEESSSENDSSTSGSGSELEEATQKKAPTPPPETPKRSKKKKNRK